MCLARTNWDVPKHRGLTWFLVPTDAPGVTVERIRQINGNSEFCQEFFSDVELTDDDVIGEVNDGWTVTQTMLLYERGGGTAAATADAPAAAVCGATSSSWSRRSTGPTTPACATWRRVSTSTTWPAEHWAGVWSR